MKNQERPAIVFNLILVLTEIKKQYQKSTQGGVSSFFYNLFDNDKSLNKTRITLLDEAITNLHNLLNKPSSNNISFKEIENILLELVIKSREARQQLKGENLNGYRSRIDINVCYHWFGDNQVKFENALKTHMPGTEMKVIQSKKS